MTARQVFEGVQIELNKVEAPSLLLEDFNYLFNKAISAFVNKRYNYYDMNQQTTDDVRVLKSTVVLTPSSARDKYLIAGQSNWIDGDGSLDNVALANALHGATYEVTLPKDYLHLLNCTCVYKVNKKFKCYTPGSYVQFGAKRLTADMWGQVINNWYMRPSYKKPYYYLHNVNQFASLPTNPITSSEDWKVVIGTTVITKNDADDYTLDGKSLKPYAFKEGNKYSINDKAITTVTTGGESAYVIGLGLTSGTDMNGTYSVSTYNDNSGSNFPRTITIGGNASSVVEREAAQRYGNASEVRMEIRYGQDDSLFELVGVYVDYLKTPQTICLTQEQMDITEDTSQIMEFPDYVCQEIINELTMLLMENEGNPRTQSNMAVNLTIAQPAQPGQEQQQSRRRG